MKETACMLVHISGKREMTDLAGRFAAQASTDLQRRLVGVDQTWSVSPAIAVMPVYTPVDGANLSPNNQYTISIIGEHLAGQNYACDRAVNTLTLLKKEMFRKHGIVKTDNFDVRLLVCAPEPVDAARNLSVMRVVMSYGI